MLYEQLIILYDLIITTSLALVWPWQTTFEFQIMVTDDQYGILQRNIRLLFLLSNFSIHNLFVEGKKSIRWLGMEGVGGMGLGG